MTILTSVSQDYIDLLRLWLDQSLPHMNSRPRVACMDEGAFAALRADHRIDAFLAPDRLRNSPDRDLYWINRLELIVQELSGADRIVHSDADAFWIGDVEGLLARHGFDLLFSADRGHPNDIGRKWGFTLCPGFFAIRNGPAMADFTAGWMDYTRRFSDDQNGINYLLDDLGVVWEKADIDGCPGHRGRVGTEAGSFEILVLPREICARELPILAPPTAVVAHPFFDRRFRHGDVETLRQVRLDRGDLVPLDLGERPAGMAGQRLRDWALLRVMDGMDRERLTPRQLHRLAALKFGFGDPETACRLFAEALERGVPEADLAIDSFAAYAAVGNTAKARQALGTAIGATTSSRMARRYARSALSLGAPHLAARAYARLLTMGFIAPDKAVRKLGRHVRQYLTLK